jgi:hypothetical protein
VSLFPQLRAAFPALAFFNSVLWLPVAVGGVVSMCRKRWGLGWGTCRSRICRLPAIAACQLTCASPGTSRPIDGLELFWTAVRVPFRQERHDACPTAAASAPGKGAAPAAARSLPTPRFTCVLQNASEGANRSSRPPVGAGRCTGCLPAASKPVSLAGTASVTRGRSRKAKGSWQTRPGGRAAVAGCPASRSIPARLCEVFGHHQADCTGT